jgi:chorismate lyase/3-hydroxybenzoate synthase
VVGTRRLLLIGGTASIVGEDSIHPRDASAQLNETLTNLTTLISAAQNGTESPHGSLGRICDLRIHITRSQDAAAVHATIRARCPGVARTEFVLARLCRPELLVEIEGVAEI